VSRCRLFQTCLAARRIAEITGKKRDLPPGCWWALRQKFFERIAQLAIEWHFAISSTGATSGELPMPGRSRLRPITLSAEEHSQLRRWSRSGRRTGPALALRARIVLRCRQGCSNREVARRVGVTAQTVCKWRQRFVAARLSGLLDQPRSGAPRSISDALVEAVLTKTLHEHPPDAERWSSRRLASELGISQRAILRIWHAFDVRA
jgi:transposase